MKYEKAKKYDKYMDLYMGPNPVKLEEELLLGNRLEKGSTVIDLGCGNGVTSVFLSKEYGLRIFATDLWGSPTDHMRFFESAGLTGNEIIPIKADATNLPFAEEFFDGIVCTDSYNYFGRDKAYLDEKLAPFVKHGGYIYLAITGMKKDLHDNLPKELLLSWTPEQLDYIHDADYWRDIISASKETEIIELAPMESNEECWNDWIKLDNEYAIGDRKSVEAGALKYMNFIKIVLRRK